MTFPSIMESRYDSVFRAIVTAGWANQSDGDVSCPMTGHFARIGITENDADFSVIGGMAAEVFDDQESILHTYGVDHLPVGQFMVLENDQGQVWAFRFHTEAEVIQAFQSYEATYAAWMEVPDDL